MSDKFKMKKLKKDQLYFMCYGSGYREYFAIGKNLDMMAEKIIKRYNIFCSEEYQIKSLKAMAANATEDGYHLNTYIIDIDSASDTEYLEFENGIYLGDYLEKVRSEEDGFRWQHIEFSDGSNPYICKTRAEFTRMTEKYDLERVGEYTWYAEVELEKDLFSAEE